MRKTKKFISTILFVTSCILFSNINLYAQDFRNVQNFTNFKQQDIKREQPIYKRLICPNDNKEFQVTLYPSKDVSILQGISPIICPYDGTKIFLDFGKTDSAKEEKVVKLLRSPVTGREFEAEIDMDKILRGQGQVFISPYDGTKFKIGIEMVDEIAPSQSGALNVTCPNCGRTFQAKVPSSGLKQVVCPYDGTKFTPSRNSIEKMIKKTNVNSAVTQMDKQKNKMTAHSKIEKMFLQDVPTSISRDIKQFGYDIFPELLNNRQTRVNQGAYFAIPGMSSPMAGGSGVAIPMMGAGTTLSGVGGMDNFGMGKQQGLSQIMSASSVPVGDDYVLGPGDTIILNLWGNIQQTSPVTLDSEGKIMLPKAGPVYLWGTNFKDAREKIYNILSKYYTNFQMDINMGKLRTIRVFVLGEINRPGSYILSSQATLFHALYAAYGPTKTGTLRKIKLIRADNTVEIIDLYDIIIRGNKSKDIKLRANDTILIPPIGEVVGIAGGVKRPAIYELVNTITLAELITLSGGISSTGYIKHVQVERITEHKRRNIIDLEFSSISELTKKGNNIDIQDGDLVLISDVNSLKYNIVTISGNVAYPGRYELKNNMTIKDLIDKAGGVLPDTYLSRIEVLRFVDGNNRHIIPVDMQKIIKGDESQNITLKQWDNVVVYNNSFAKPAGLVEISGEVNNPGRYVLTDNMRVSDLIFRAKGLKNDASLKNAEIFRIGDDLEPEVIKLDLEDLFSDKSSSSLREGASSLLLRGTENDKIISNDIILKNGDQLFIRKNYIWDERRVITLKGEFKYPGKYTVMKGEKLSSVIKRAGGFTEKAFLKGAVFTRKSIRNKQKKILKKFLEKEQNALLQDEASRGLGYPAQQRTARMKIMEYREQMIENIDNSDFIGRMVIRLSKDIDKFKESSANIKIEDEDMLYVPSEPSSVQIIGNVYNPTSLTYIPGKKINYYLRKVGGITKYADKKQIYIIRANGEVKSRFVKSRKLEPGDVIIVPEKIKYKTALGPMLKDTFSLWSQIIFGAIAITAATN